MRELRRVYKGFGVALLVASRVLIGQDAQATGSTVAFDLPAGEFSKTIREFGRQANIKVWYTSVGANTEGITTRAVTGDLSPSEALSRMLEGTGCTFEWEGTDRIFVSVHPIAEPPSSEPAAAVQSVQPGANPQEQVSSAERATISEVRVTGTYLRTAEGAVAPIVRVLRRGLNRTGFATAEAALDVLPMTFLGGARADAGNTTLDNYGHGEAPNLRGLGVGATLVLVNGRRPPASGANGSFRDISVVPISLIERIEVMPDGASALYGSDAIAGVVNVVLRDDVDNPETRTRVATVRGVGGDEVLLAQLTAAHWDTGHALLGYQYAERDALSATERAFVWNGDKRPYGGSDFRSYQSNPGNILDQSTLLPAYAIPHNQDGRGLSLPDLQPGYVNLQSPFVSLDLFPERRTHSLYFTGAQALHYQYEAFAELRYNLREEREYEPAENSILTVPSSNAFFIDPFGGSPDVLVAYSFYDDLGPTQRRSRTESFFGTVGVRGKLPNDWRATLSVSSGRESLRWNTSNLVDEDALDRALADSDPATAFNPFGAGSTTSPSTLDAIRKSLLEQATSTIAYVDLVGDGPLLRLPSGKMNLAVGIGARREQLMQSQAGTSDVRKDYARDNAFGFAELLVPLARRFDLSIAGRYERYSDFGSAFNEKVGIRWSPNSAIKVRGSWGSSFRAPLLVDLDESNIAAGFLSLADPRSPTGRSRVIGVQGNNSKLRQETASSWTAGVDLSSPSLPGIVASFTYFDVDYQGRIARPGTGDALLSILADENKWGEPVIVRSPSRAEVDPLCNVPRFFGSRSDCLNGALPDAIVDIRARNLAATSVAGVDIAFAQSIELQYGELHWAIDGTYLRRFSQRVTPASAAVSLVNEIDNPLALRARGTVEWYQNGEELPGFGASLTTHFANRYEDNRSVPRRRIGSSTTFDIQMTYRTAAGTGLLSDMEIACGAVNVLDEKPPFANTIYGYDIGSGEPTGQQLTASIHKHW